MRGDGGKTLQFDVRQGTQRTDCAAQHARAKREPLADFAQSTTTPTVNDSPDSYAEAKAQSAKARRLEIDIRLWSARDRWNRQARESVHGAEVRRRTTQLCMKRGYVCEVLHLRGLTFELRWDRR